MATSSSRAMAFLRSLSSPWPTHAKGFPSHTLVKNIITTTWYACDSLIEHVEHRHADTKTSRPGSVRYRYGRQNAGPFVDSRRGWRLHHNTQPRPITRGRWHPVNTRRDDDDAPRAKQGRNHAPDTIMLQPSVLTKGTLTRDGSSAFGMAYRTKAE